MCVIHVCRSSAAEVSGTTFEYHLVFKVIFGKSILCGPEISACLLPCLNVVPMG